MGSFISNPENDIENSSSSPSPDDSVSIHINFIPETSQEILEESFEFNQVLYFETYLTTQAYKSIKRIIHSLNFIEITEESRYQKVFEGLVEIDILLKEYQQRFKTIPKESIQERMRVIQIIIREFDRELSRIIYMYIKDSISV
jgi:hypothetical protein